MIINLQDSATGTIEKFPHKMVGGLGISRESSGITFGCLPGDEILHMTSQYFYVRDPSNSNDAKVYDENGYYVKTVNISEVPAD